MTRLALLTLAAGLASTAAYAQRQSTTDLTCPQAQSIVARAGGIVLGTGGPTYDRFVRDRTFCAPTEYTKAAYAPTRTNPQCFVGYTCFEPGRSDWFGDY
ncbi:hypothetical protein [Methylobacterium oxalidis]|uniref:Uncharacterized protein n=1 Tax=Methylobacterium oxalidis TaxID=944322 RepID=A0A512IWV0_9HYPH|nr:hypothetical protein [Methylobacterium oxalidis]GEP02175.1 hypothetical protein MOX02_02130 [Methylobacterium oxalidis]GJE32166.1 hypothetical protein LDDCCGHA_2349 [Methylobacterium oxalidis]GLS62120.1 hypothetical protein GCM10007888_05010 [Methylobacterium oxalidis]